MLDFRLSAITFFAPFSGIELINTTRPSKSGIGYGYAKDAGMYSSYMSIPLPFLLRLRCPLGKVECHLSGSHEF